MTDEELDIKELNMIVFGDWDVSMVEPDSYPIYRIWHFCPGKNNRIHDSEVTDEFDGKHICPACKTVAPPEVVAYYNLITL